MALGTTAQEILSVVSGNDPVDVNTLAAELERTPDSVRSALYRLIDQGFVRVRTNKEGFRVYSRTAAGTKALKRA